MKTMKTSGPKLLKTTMFLTTIALVLIFTLASCATKAKFLDSSIVPAAQGYVKMKTDRNKNYQIKIEIYNLALPGKLNPPKNVYIVWMDDGNANIKNMGQVKSSSAFMSKALKASFQNISSFRPIKIFITSEYEANVQVPSQDIILSTNNF
jgi:hypothetical protein